MEIVTDKCRKILPEIYGRSRLEEIGQGMEQMNSRMDRLERATQNIIDMGSRQNQEERLQQRMETEKRPETEKKHAAEWWTDIGANSQMGFIRSTGGRTVWTKKKTGTKISVSLPKHGRKNVMFIRGGTFFPTTYAQN